MRTSESIGQLADALAKAQGRIKAATKDAENPHFKSKYADLTAIMAACREPLSANGIAVVQGVSAEAAAVTVTTRLLHSSGEWIESALTAQARDASPQSIGSVTSYCKRYGLSALVGVVADEDDDAETAQGRPKGKAAAAPKPVEVPRVPAPAPTPAPVAASAERTISEAQIKRFWALARKNSWTDADVKALLAKHGYASSKAITVSAYDGLIQTLETGALPDDREPGSDDDDLFPAPWESQEAHS
jgi:hypothetical protein